MYSFPYENLQVYCRPGIFLRCYHPFMSTQEIKLSMSSSTYYYFIVEIPLCIYWSQCYVLGIPSLVCRLWTLALQYRKWDSLGRPIIGFGVWHTLKQWGDLSSFFFLFYWGDLIPVHYWDMVVELLFGCVFLNLFPHNFNTYLFQYVGLAGCSVGSWFSRCSDISFWELEFGSSMLCFLSICIMRMFLPIFMIKMISAII